MGSFYTSMSAILRIKTIVVFYLVVFVASMTATWYGVDLPDLNVGTLVLVFLFMYPFVYVHELGHVLAGLAVGIGISRVAIGGGREIFRKKIGRILFVQRIAPGNGITYIGEMSAPPSKLALLAFWSGGALLQIIVMVPLLVFGNFTMHDLLSPEGLHIGSALVAANGLLLLVSLVPFPVRIQGVRVLNDGLKILTIPFMQPHEVASFPSHGPIMHAYELMERRDYSAAERMLEECVQHFPSSTVARVNLATCLMKRGQLGPAIDLLQRLLEGDHEHKYDFMIHNNLAWATLLQGTDESLALAEAFSAQAYKHRRSVRYVQGTRASVLAALGEHDQAARILKHGVRPGRRVDKQTNPIAGFIVLGYAYRQLGRGAIADRYMRVVDQNVDQLDADERLLFEMLQARSDDLQ